MQTKLFGSLRAFSQQSVGASLSANVQMQSSRGPARGGRGGRGGRAGRVGRPKTETVVITTPVPDNAKVAIIGGGLSGLVCAHECLKHGLVPTVFDTGEHGCGGRLATRKSSDRSLSKAPRGLNLIYDHAAQFFTTSDPWFQQLVSEWQDAGVVRTWNGPVGTVQLGEFVPSEATRYVGVQGMRGIADHLAATLVSAGVELRRPCWISDTIYSGDGRWNLIGRNESQGTFDFVVVAHNGKCANSLLRPAGVPRVAAAMSALQLSSIWVLMVAFEQPVAAPGKLEGAFVADNGVISWCANNSKKLQVPGDGAAECWTIMSTPEYAKRNKVPQENVPKAKSEQVTRDLLKAFRVAMGLDSLPDTLHTQTQLWGAALPMNTPGVPCVLDQQSRMGICGDWLSGSSMQAAALSGRAMAKQLALARESPAASCGLYDPAKPLEGSPIGQFPDAGIPSSLQAQHV